jgi:hypothetical protein
MDGMGDNGSASKHTPGNPRGLQSLPELRHTKPNCTKDWPSILHFILSSNNCWHPASSLAPS